QLDVQLVSLETPDGVSLSVMYYPAAVEVSEDEEDKEKQREEAERQRMEAVPIMILHHWKGQAADYEPLARYLQSRGHAVVVPDLRGHGESRDAEQNPDLFKD
ncbi:MAG: hypothetical protein GTO03_15495, partial [Planctomycetales bacterium]|nr:hypothetical protein [Planctomycetales bacterium]